MGNTGMEGDSCYLAIFDHGLKSVEDSQTVIIGNKIMQNNYWVFDMSPLE